MSAVSHKPPPRRLTSAILLLLAHLPTARTGFTLAPGDDCTVSANGACVESDGYGAGDDYKDAQRCSITLQPSAALEVISFAVEDYFDHMTISGTQYTGTNGPAGLPTTDRWSWAIHRIGGRGQELRQQQQHPRHRRRRPAVACRMRLRWSRGRAPSPPAATASAPTITPGVRHNKLRDRADAGLRLSSTAFATEKNYDMLTIGGNVHRHAGPDVLSVTANQKIEWVGLVRNQPGCAFLRRPHKISIMLC